MQDVFEKIKERLDERRKEYEHASEQIPFGNQHCYYKGLMRGYEYSIENVNQVAEEYNDGWIPCSERLPEEGDEYYPICIVSLENGDVCLGVYRYDESAWYTRMSEGEEVYSTKHKVLAWQPLPAPYKPKGEK